MEFRIKEKSLNPPLNKKKQNERQGKRKMSKKKLSALRIGISVVVILMRTISILVWFVACLRCGSSSSGVDGGGVGGIVYANPTLLHILLSFICHFDLSRSKS